MTATAPLDCPWCSHQSDDGNAFRTHLMVEHRKSDVVEYVVRDRMEGPSEVEQDEPIAH